MMRMSSKGRFSLRALLHLTIMQQGEPVSVSGIAEKMEVSPDYLMQLFVKMRRNGLLTSIRGPKGGFLLSRSPDKITVGDIVRSVEGQIAPIDCVAESVIGCNPEEWDNDICKKADDCLSRIVWLRLSKSITDVLDGLTLADVIAEAKRDKKL